MESARNTDQNFRQDRRLFPSSFKQRQTNEVNRIISCIQS